MSNQGYLTIRTFDYGYGGIGVHVRIGDGDLRLPVRVAAYLAMLVIEAATAGDGGIPELSNNSGQAAEAFNTDGLCKEFLEGQGVGLFLDNDEITLAYGPDYCAVFDRKHAAAFGDKLWSVVKLAMA